MVLLVFIFSALLLSYFSQFNIFTVRYYISQQLANYLNYYLLLWEIHLSLIRHFLLQSKGNFGIFFFFFYSLVSTHLTDHLLVTCVCLLDEYILLPQLSYISIWIHSEMCNMFIMVSIILTKSVISKLYKHLFCTLDQTIDLVIISHMQYLLSYSADPGFHSRVFPLTLNLIAYQR